MGQSRRPLEDDSPGEDPCGADRILRYERTVSYLSVLWTAFGHAADGKFWEFLFRRRPDSAELILSWKCPSLGASSEVSSVSVGFVLSLKLLEEAQLLIV